MYYVYFLVDPSTMLPFYVGKGTGRRAHQHLWNYKRQANLYKKHVVEQIFAKGQKPIVHILVAEIDDEKLAFSIEEHFIALFGLRADGSGILTNLLRDNTAYKTQEKLLTGRHYFQTIEHATECRERMRNLHAAGKHPSQLAINRQNTSSRNKQWLNDGVHPFQGKDSPGVISSRNRIRDGSHHFLQPEHSSRTSAENKRRARLGAHNFQSDSSKAGVRERNSVAIADGTHPFLGKDGAGTVSSRQRVAEGTHHFFNRDISALAQKKNIEKNGLRVQRVNVIGHESFVWESVEAAIKATPNATRRMIRAAAQKCFPYCGFWWRVLGSERDGCLAPWTAAEIAALPDDRRAYNRLGTLVRTS